MENNFYNKNKNLFIDTKLPYQDNMDKINELYNKRNKITKNTKFDSLDRYYSIYKSNISELKNNLQNLRQDYYFNNPFKTSQNNLNKYFPKENFESIEDNPYNQQAIYNFLNKKEANKQINEIKKERTQFINKKNLYSQWINNYKEHLSNLEDINL